MYVVFYFLIGMLLMRLLLYFYFLADEISEKWPPGGDTRYWKYSQALASYYFRIALRQTRLKWGYIAIAYSLTSLFLFVNASKHFFKSQF